MEEIEYKLRQNNPVIITQAISKLVDIIKLKIQNAETQDKPCEELQLLKSKCADENPTVAMTASHGIVSLTEDTVIPVGTTLSDLLFNLSNTKNPNGIIHAISKLLLLDLIRNVIVKQKYVCPFGIRKAQHPFITILSQNSDHQYEIYNHIQFFVKNYNNKVAQNSLEFLRPVIFYIFCNPSAKLNSVMCRQIWSLLISNCFNDDNEILIDILTWVQVNEKLNIKAISEFLIELSHLSIQKNDVPMCSYIFLYLSDLIKKILQFGYNPTWCINALIEIVDKVDVGCTHSMSLLMLSEVLLLSPPVYLKELLVLCKKIVSKRSSNIISIKSLSASILQWILYPTNLLSESLKVVKDILLLIENNDNYTTCTGHLQRNKYFISLQGSNECIDLQYKLCLLAEKWQHDDKDLSAWLSIAYTCPSIIRSRLFTFLSGIFLNNYTDPQISIKTLNIFVKLVEIQPEFASRVLVLIIHRLSVETDPNAQLELMRAFPKMAVLKENIPIVISTLEKIRNGPGCLRTFAFDLYYRLWEINNRTFPYLNKLISENGNVKDKWEYGVAKAHMLKKICAKRPDLYSKDMVLHLSQILSKNGDEKGSNASALAIDGITCLCEAGIVDIISTWKSLSPRFAKEKRPLVLKSLCGMLSLFGNLRTSTVNYDAIMNDVLMQLWKITSSSAEIEIYAAATKALSNFSISEFQLKQLPYLYRQHIKLPSSYAKTPVDAARKAEDVLPYIPGECWVEFLCNTNNDFINLAGDLLTEWVRVEIAEYRSGVYAVEKQEPENYNYLPAKSIVRGLGNYIRLIAISQSKLEYSEKAVEECLRVFTQKYSKPLPPLNWCFLHELIHKSENIKRLCLSLACKQVQISGSARRLLENFLSEFEVKNVENVKEMSMLFRNMEFLGKGIQPNILRPFVTNSLNYAYDNWKSEDNNGILFVEFINNIKLALQGEEIHDANRILLSQIVETFCETMDPKDKVFDDFAQCITEIQVKYIERVSTPSLWWEVKEDKFEKAVIIRCLVAIKSQETPFVWLNECINTATTLTSCQGFVLKNICKVFREHRKHSTGGSWILELMGQIQEKLTNDNTSSDEIIFLCDVFVVAIIVLSGYECLTSPVEMVVMSREIRLNLFLISLYYIVTEGSRNIGTQIMEWLYHMSICIKVTQPYQSIFYSSLTALRQEKIFSEPARWSKYVLLQRPTNL